MYSCCLKTFESSVYQNVLEITLEHVITLGAVAEVGLRPIWQAVLIFNPHLQISAINCRYLQLADATVCNRPIEISVIIADICKSFVDI